MGQSHWQKKATTIAQAGFRSRTERGHKDAYGSDAGSANSQTALQIPFLPVSDMLTLVGLSDSSRIQLIKIDTEGNELQILEAMLPILQHWQVSNMVVEVTPMWWRHTGYTTQTKS